MHKVAREIVATLKREGWEIITTNGGHLKIWPPRRAGVSRPFILSSAKSEYAYTNFRRDLAREGFMVLECGTSKKGTRRESALPVHPR